MSVVVIFSVLIVGLFTTAFITKRRFGVLGLALAAGAILSSYWSKDVTAILRQSGIDLVLLPLPMAVAIVLILLPAVLLLLRGPVYKQLTGRIFGSIAFAALALAFMIEPLGSTLLLIGWERDVYNFFAENRVYIITAGIGVAVFDLIGTKAHKHPKEKAKH